MFVVTLVECLLLFSNRLQVGLNPLTLEISRGMIYLNKSELAFISTRYKRVREEKIRNMAIIQHGNTGLVISVTMEDEYHEIISDKYHFFLHVER